MNLKLIKDRALSFVKNETVFSVAAVLAVLSAFFVRPDRGYIDYIDFRTLTLLFCLMTIMAGFGKVGVFRFLAMRLIKKAHGVRSIIFIPIVLCFFFSMIITNDVALITFVPFTITALKLAGNGLRERFLVPVAVMETIAANLGSMLTPIGNPQNLYLQGISGLGAVDFMGLMLPYGALSFIMIIVWTFLRKGKGEINIDIKEDTKISDKKSVGIYIILFCLCLCTVARITDYRITFIIVLAVVFIVDRNIFKKPDYCLLATFAAFFIFIGNMERIPLFGGFVESVVEGRECITGIISSQIISNVPAALLLSGFTDNFRPLIIGVNLGGLGTLIASMASLISFKIVTHNNKPLKGKFMKYFTIANIVFLAVLFTEYIILKA